MAQTLTASPHHLSPFAGAHMVEGEKGNSHKLPSDLWIREHTHKKLIHEIKTPF